ncbi:cysteine--tRNA ligase [Patescibacteria group bacterium]|nr:cysteine--tRNA ligase [Patescibacteria group bacterium]MBU1931619.1 cysteine--tRNA ligase [Patescibacteria group bacterium]
MKLYNSLTKKIEQLQPINPPKVTMYTCGPTVYDYAHIGNFRTYILSDILQRSLTFLGYQVKAVMNITDVGHLVSDADEGEDKLEKGARREHKTAWEIAAKYTEIFKADAQKLNIQLPEILCKATDYINEQIELIKTLEQKGYTYKTSDGLYFNTSKFANYAQLAQLDAAGLKEGARVAKNPEKKQLTDFALWKFSPSPPAGGKSRDMEWDSPWGKGFPGWHVECSAMAMKHLGDTLDIHVGGVDLKPVHHTNEIAQSEAATGKPFVKYWVHGEFILADGKKMSKSKANFYNLADIEVKGFKPLSLRYLYLNAHYRTHANFTWPALMAAEKAYKKLLDYMAGLAKSRSALTQEHLNKIDGFSQQFRDLIADDLKMPEALALVWQVVKSNIPNQDKRDLLLDCDQVLGLNLAAGLMSEKAVVPSEVRQLVDERETARQQKDWFKSDQLRRKITQLGWQVEDTSAGPKLKANS